jgi:hypothetical protein
MVKQNDAQQDVKRSFAHKGLLATTMIMSIYILIALILTQGSGLFVYTAPHILLTLVMVLVLHSTKKLPQILLYIVLAIGILGAASAIYLGSVFIPYILNP